MCIIVWGFSFTPAPVINNLNSFLSINTLPCVFCQIVLVQRNITMCDHVSFYFSNVLLHSSLKTIILNCSLVSSVLYDYTDKPFITL